MALSDKDIVITPNKGQSSDPQIVFSGASSTLGPQNITLRVYPTDNGTLSFEGSAGQLFSITNSLTGSIFSVNDVSGIPSIEVFDTGNVRLAQYSGNVLLGTATDNATDKLQVNGSITGTVLKSSVATGTAPLTVTSTTAVTNLNADLLDGNHASAFYLATNPSGYTTNVGTVTSVGGTGTVSGLTLSGTVTTSGNLTLSGTLAVTASNFASQTANTFLAAPNGAAGVPTFRAIVAADVPTLNQNTTGTAANVTGTVAIANGGTGATTAQAAINALAAATTSGQYLRGNGTNVVMSAIQAGDVPTLNQNTTGSAATLTTARNIGDVSFNGSADIVPSRITFKDTRATDFNPNSYAGISLHLKTNTTDSLADGGTYHGILNLQHWSDLSGGNNHQLAFTDNNNIYIRQSASATTWGAWAKIWSDSNDGASSGLDADLLDGNHASAFYLATNPSGYTSNTGTVTSVGGTGTVSGLTLSGTVTTSGNLTLGGTLAVTASNFASQTANTFLAAPNGAAGTPTFRAIVAADVPTLNQNTTGSAATLTTARTLTIGSTGKTFDGSANVSWTLAEIGALGSSAKAADSELLDGVDSGSFLRSDAADTLSSIITIDATGNIVYSDSGGTYIPRPSAASYKTTAATITGACTIQLPTALWANINDMVSFWVDIYDYNANESVSIFVYGYAYGSSTGQWTNTGATILTPRTDRDYTVRFCHDGTRHVVCIGEITSTWSYPQVVVRDFQAGYTAAASTFDNGWEITFLTTLPTVMSTNSGNLVVAKSASTLTTARTINGTSFDGSANITITANTTNTLTRGTYLTGSNFNGSAATTWDVDATSANTASKVVARDASGNFTAGTITATDFNSTSDVSLKENIKPAPGYDALSKINAVEFTWKSSGKKSYGVIAQELEETMPELVSQDEDGIKTVSYTPLIAVLTNTVKEQQDRINRLEEIINTLLAKDK